MATALQVFNYLQYGRESTKGNAVASTRDLIGNFTVREIQDVYYSEYPRGVNATVGGDGVVTMKGVEWTLETELTPQEFLLPVLGGILGNITATAGTSDYTWVGTPTLTGDPTLDSFTMEFGFSDGSTNHIIIECYYNMVTSYDIEFPKNGVCKLTVNGFGRARQSTAPTAALTEYANRHILKSALTTWYVDTTWAGLGGTQLASTVRSAKIHVDCFPKPNWTQDGRSDLDFVNHRVTPIGGTIDLTIEKNASGATQYGAWRDRTRRYIRQKTTGGTIGSAVYTVQHDMSVSLVTADPNPSEDNQGLIALTGKFVYDTTGTKILLATAINDLAAVANI